MTVVPEGKGKLTEEKGASETEPVQWQKPVLYATGSHFITAPLFIKIRHRVYRPLTFCEIRNSVLALCDL